MGIGNLCMGGAGKSPLAAYVIDHLRKTYSVALVTRGYGRETKGNLLATADGLPPAENEHRPCLKADAKTVGDEPAMMARRFPGLTVMASAKRREGVAQLMSLENPPDRIVFDDVFQHRYVRPTLNILVTAYNNLYVHDSMPPLGRLREPRSGSRRADIIVVSKCPMTMDAAEKERIVAEIKPLPHQKVFFSSIGYQKPLPLFPESAGRDSHFEPGDAVLLVTGIADPKPLEETLMKIGKVTLMRFGDHHFFTAEDCDRIAKRFESIDATRKAIVTTEKDAMRLLLSPGKAHLSSLPLFYLPIEVIMHDAQAFKKCLNGEL